MGVLATALAACSPALDWRDTTFPEADGAVALFPCKPDRVARAVTLAGDAVKLSVAACGAANATFALSHVDVGEVVQVGPALTALRTAAANNVGGALRVVAPAAVGGMSPHALAQRVAIDGRRPDGRPLREQALFFAKGTRVFQATVISETIDPEAADTFFAAFRFPA